MVVAVASGDRALCIADLALAVAMSGQDSASPPEPLADDPRGTLDLQCISSSSSPSRLQRYTRRETRFAFLSTIVQGWARLTTHAPTSGDSTLVAHSIGAPPAPEWDPRRCLVMQLMQRESCGRCILDISVYARNILRDEALSNVVSKILVCASVTLRWYDVKQFSYQGACTRPHTHGRGWHWFDPGNFVYAVGWHLLLLESCHDARFLRLHRAMCACMERWPRCWTPSSNGYEALGDLMEMLLSAGYCETQLECIVRGFSPLFAAIKSLENWIRDHGAYDLPGCPQHKAPWPRNPRDMARILMQANAWRMRGLTMEHPEATQFIRRAKFWCYLYS